MFAITKIMQPLGPHDRLSFYQCIRPVCFGAGWYTPEGVRPLACHDKEELDADHLLKRMGAAEATMLRGIYCKMIHNTDYPGDFLLDIAFILEQQNIGPLRKRMVALYNYDPFTLKRSQTTVLRLLHFICWGIENGNITQSHLIAIWKHLPIVQAKERASIWSCLPKKGRDKYVKARERALFVITDTTLRGFVDRMVVEAYARYIICAIAMFEGYINLTALISWHTMYR